MSSPITALAPNLQAFPVIRSKASILAFSISDVKAETSPPTIDWIPATNFLPTPLVRAVKPVTMPTTLFTRKPGTEGVVTMTMSELRDLASIGDSHREQNFSPSATPALHLGQKDNYYHQIIIFQCPIKRCQNLNIFKIEL